MSRRPLCGVCLFIISFILVSRWTGIPLFGEPALTSEEKETLADGFRLSAAGIVSDRSEGEETFRYTLSHVRVTLGGRQIPFQKILVSMEKDGCPYPLGSLLSVKGELQPVEAAGNPGQFDAAAYYGCRGIWYRLWADHAQVLRKGGGLRENLQQIREKAECFFTDSLGKEESGILTAMLLGDKTLLTDEVRLDFQTGGCLHLLVISGLHISLLGMALFQMFLRLGLPQAAAGISAGFLMALYTVMTGASAASVRALIMFLAFLLSRLSKRSYDSLSAMALAASLILLKSPGYLFDSGFQLSFSAAYGASILSPVLRKKLPFPFDKKDQPGAAMTAKRRRAEAVTGKERLKKLARAQWESAVSWLAIQLCTLPLIAYYFYEIPVWSLPLNLLLVPWARYILFLGAAGGAAGLVLPAAGKLILLPVNGILFLYDTLLRAARQLPAGTWICGKPELWQAAAFYICLAAGMCLFQKKPLPVKKAGKAYGGSAGADRRRRHSPLCVRNKALLGTGAFLLAGLVLLFWRSPDGFSLTMLNVGQGDCIVVREGSRVFLSDGGSTNVSEVGKYRILPYLKSQRIRRIETVLLSHDDADHINGIEELLVMIAERETAVRIRCLAMPVWMAETESGRRIREECRAAGTEVLLLEHGDRIRSGGLDIEVLHPFRTQAEGVTGRGITAEQGRAGAAEINADQPVTVSDGVPYGGMQSGNGGSLVLQVRYRRFSALLTGDLEREGEEELIPYLSDIDCLKAGHHGSRWSSSEEFLEAAQPEIALISAPERSLYGHPHQETLDRLEEAGAVIFATKDCGAVTLYEKKGRILIKQWKRNPG